MDGKGFRKGWTDRQTDGRYTGRLHKQSGGVPRGWRCDKRHCRREKNEKGGRGEKEWEGGRSKWEGVMVKGASGAGRGMGDGGGRGGRGAICSQLKGGAADGGERSVGSNDQSAGHTEGFLFQRSQRLPWR